MTIAIDETTRQVEPGTPATDSENLLTLLGGIWLTLGLFIDGYAHSNIIDTETEDFFTPWHGIFYTGFALTAGWIGYLMYRRRNPDGIRTWIPPGYGWAVVGLITFAIGGLGDGVWHTVFGVEVGVDALLSPTHLLLLFGLITLLAVPFRIIATQGGPIWVAITSLTLVATLAAFFTTFARPITSGWVLGIRFNPAIDDDIWATWMVAGTIVTTMIMAVSAVYLLQRFPDLPFGAITVLWTVPVVFEGAALSSTNLDVLGSGFLAGLAGGLVADLALRTVTGTRGVVALISLTLGTLVTWTVWTALSGLFISGLNMPPEVWAGQILLSLFVTAGIALLGFPTRTRDLGH